MPLTLDSIFIAEMTRCNEPGNVIRYALASPPPTSLSHGRAYARSRNSEKGSDELQEVDIETALAK